MLGNPAICTLKTARRLYPDAPSKSLGKITRYLKIRHKNVHRALGDATATAKLLIKMFSSLRENYDVETISDIINFQNLPSGKPLKIIKKKMADNIANVPDAPGVYFFKNTKDDTIYIGKAKSLKQRISNYFASNSPKKTKEIARKADGLEFRITNTELTALLAEAELIKEHNPKLNKLLKQYSRNYFIKLSTAENFAAADVSSKFDFDGNDYFGPYPNRETANSIKEIIDKTFMLRECANKELAKKRKCYLSDIERCLAPCVDNELKNLYTDEIKKVHEFLSGHNQSAVDRLLAKMKELSAKQKFEEAALVRDVINSILKQLNKASILSEPLNKANVLVEILGEKNNDYVLLLEGKMFIYNFFANKTNYFEEALNDYFAGTRILFSELTDKDLERLKITLNWLIKNKHKIKIHYLKD
jgi:DNA polymerase-3 subunit epsilon